jgi:sucrose-6F-phosphate phosphohydrolase
MIQHLLLCTDLDRTLLPNGPQPESPQARKLFSRLVSLPQVTLVYVTGRHLGLIDEAIAEYQLPLPEFTIADVGSTIYANNSGKWLHWSQWDERIASDWAGMTHAGLVAMFSELSGLVLQEPEKQGIHKLSYYLSPDVGNETVIAEMKTRLDDSAIRANLVFSVDEMAGTGLLDVLPESAGKQQAIEFLMASEGFALDETVFCGDSGNDLAVLASPIQAVLVANASPDVRQMAIQQADTTGYSQALYVAGGGYQGMNGNYSAGILEGVVHYIPQVQDWLG